MSAQTLVCLPIIIIVIIIHHHHQLDGINVVFVSALRDHVINFMHVASVANAV